MGAVYIAKYLPSIITAINQYKESEVTWTIRRQSFPRNHTTAMRKCSGNLNNNNNDIGLECLVLKFY